MAINKIDAIKNLEPNAEFVLVDDVITEWHSEDITQPTDDWERNRQAEYPSLENCIHALLDGGDTLTDLQAQRQVVKDNHPKP